MARILIIDDDEPIREFCRDVLEEAGHSVDDAAGGGPGLELYAARPYDLVLCDIVMPGMNGLLTISELVAAFPAARVVAVSGAHAEVGDYLTAALQLGAVATIRKPFDADTLLERVDATLAQS